MCSLHYNMSFVLLLSMIAHTDAQSTAALDALGPISVGKDGSLNRIANWDELTTQERLAAKRALQRRNAKRLKQLREQDISPVCNNPFSRLIKWIRKRILPPLDFAPEFVLPIETGQKQATTRWLCSSGGEPHLGRLHAGNRVRATCNRCAKGSREIGVLKITRTEIVSFAQLSDELAAQEGLQDGDARGAPCFAFIRSRAPIALVLHFAIEEGRNGCWSRAGR